MRNSTGVRGVAHLVELNVMLGRPEGLTPTSTVRIQGHSSSMSAVIPIGEHSQEVNQQEGKSDCHRRK